MILILFSVSHSTAVRASLPEAPHSKTSIVPRSQLLAPVPTTRSRTTHHAMACRREPRNRTTRPKLSSLPSISRIHAPRSAETLHVFPTPRWQRRPLDPQPSHVRLLTPPLAHSVLISPTPTKPAAILRRHLQRSRGPVRRWTRTTLWGRLGAVLPLPAPGPYLRGQRERCGRGHGLGRKPVRETRRGLRARRWGRGAPGPRDGGSGKEPRGARPIRRVLRRAPREDHRVPPADPGD